jgi:voltage-gated potassium channel
MKESSLIKRVIISLLIFLLIITFSVTGYMVIEKWDFFDSIYMTIITISGIGYGEVKPLSIQGRIHTMIVIITGVGFYSSMIVYFSTLFVEGSIRGILRRKKMEKRIQNLKGHYIICGYGRIGREVCEALKEKREKIHFLIIERNTDRAHEAMDEGYLVYVGDSTDDQVLINVGIKRARGIICALPDDALNVFITLSCRVLNPNVNIIARADRADSVDKLKRAGAHNVVAPYITGGKRIATAVTQPYVLDFLDILLHDEKFDLQMEQVLVVPGSELINKTLQTSDLFNRTGVLIIGIKKADGDLVPNPQKTDYVNSGDMLIAMGNSKQMEKLIKLANAKI